MKINTFKNAEKNDCKEFSHKWNVHTKIFPPRPKEHHGSGVKETVKPRDIDDIKELVFSRANREVIHMKSQ